MVAIDNTCVYYSRPSRTTNQKKRSKRQVKYKTRTKIKHERATSPIPKRRSLYATATRPVPKRRLFPVIISLHVGDNTCVYYSKEHLRVTIIYLARSYVHPNPLTIILQEITYHKMHERRLVIIMGLACIEIRTF